MALRCLPVLSLRQMAMMNIAIYVCNDPDIQDFVKENGSFSFIFPSERTQQFLDLAKGQATQIWAWKSVFLDGKSTHPIINFTANWDRMSQWDMMASFPPFKTWKELVEKKMSSFLLPRHLQPELFDVIRLVSLEIDKWIKEHSLILLNSTEFARAAQCYFQWNSLGIIDRIKTARTLITNGSLQIEDRYILALHYGLKDDLLADRCIDFAWKKNLHMQLYFPVTASRPGKIWKPYTGESDFNYIAQRNLFIKLTSEEKMECLNTVMSKEIMLYENFLFCLSQMGDDGREAIFETYPLKILMYFLDWPFQCQFLDAARHLLPYFTLNDFQKIIELIVIDRIMLGWKDFDYIKLLKEFWSLSPIVLRQIIKRHNVYKSLVFAMNYSSSDNFPEEIDFENYNVNCFQFGFRGILYCLMKTEEPYPGEIVEFELHFRHNIGYQFGNLICVYKLRKGKHEQGIHTRIKQSKNDFISKLRDLCHWPYRLT
ncbi:uncharacterized protein NPIL_433951 [Nephila pilipes]|uniref:Uncharacterized protein n=1 Tax=Nephila pilipes TaxID=299642 RepID=A0A8X6UUG7_NEPPI|nr:uncharacterized protein NPIL_433951 [Nephila pilipes]